MERAEEKSDGLEAVLFDLGGTLDAPGVPWKERLFRLYRAEGVSITPEDFAPSFYRADDALVGAIPAALSLRDTVRRLVAGVNEALQIDDRELGQRIATRFCDDAMTCARDSARVLEPLARRYRLGVVSNFYGNLATVCAELDLRSYLSVTIDSADVGWMKPDQRIFRYALEQLGVAPAAAAFVGDSFARDMGGARAAGMPHVWLAGEVAASSAPCCPGDRVIQRLDMLRGLLL
jgi:putative hydrolase of the HAD superfamily